MIAEPLLAWPSATLPVGSCCQGMDRTATVWAVCLCPPPDCLSPDLVCLAFPPRSVSALNHRRLCRALPRACQLSTNSFLLPRGLWLVEVVLAAVSQFCPCSPV